MGSPASASPGSDSPPPTPPQPDETVEQALLEFHIDPTADLQVAIWLEDTQGNFIDDVFVTQATAKLGIGNRSGLPLFLSSWRAPYGPREGVLPIWAHRRGKTYPKIVFFDPTLGDQTSQGYHETTSSPETYFCRPLTPEEDDTIVDTMTCPSPATFSTDKGQIDDDRSSVYPPRSDLTSAHTKDSPDVDLYAALNDLDAVSGATPSAGPFMVAHRINRDTTPEGPLVAWIEVSRERDENPDWEFDRDNDHTLDASVALQHFGREFLGQPAVVYRVEFDPADAGYTAVTTYAGYADLYGASGTLFPPDSTISVSEGSGADRLREHERFGTSARFGVYSHGWGSGADQTSCVPPGTTLPPVEDLRLEAVAFDTIRATFRIPQLPTGVIPAKLGAHWITPKTDNFELSAAKEAVSIPRVCSEFDEPGALECVTAGPGDELSIDIEQLFGNFTYSIAISYADPCTERSELAIASVDTPAQPFTTIDSACFVATAAWGAGWTKELRALRWFRDSYMIGQPVANDLVRTYYAYGPVLANMIREVPPARAAARLLLRPIARLAQRLNQLTLADSG